MAGLRTFGYVQFWAPRPALGAAVISIALLSLTGCLVKPHALNTEDVKARAVKDFKAISSIEEPLTGPVDLYEAIARALKYNLDAKVKTIQIQLAHQQLNVAHYSLLPQVSANAGFDGRNNFSGGVGQSILTGRPAIEPFTSSDKYAMYGNLALSWDVLDFGLSFVRAQQAADNVMIAEEEKRRIAVRLVQEVRNAYWGPVSADGASRIQFLDRSPKRWIKPTIVDQASSSGSLTYQRDLLNLAGSSTALS